MGEHYLRDMKNKTINGKQVNDWKLVAQGDCGDDSFIEWAKFTDGSELTESELVEFEKEYMSELLWG